MSEETSDLVEELRTKISNLESEVATLSGENDRLNSIIKSKEDAIQEMDSTQKSLKDQIKAAGPEISENTDYKAQLESKDQEIALLTKKLASLQTVEDEKKSLENQIKALEADHEIEVKSLQLKLSQFENKSQNEEFNSDENQLVQVNLNIIADEDAEKDQLNRDKANPNELIQEKVEKKMKDQMDAMKEELYGLKEQHEQHTSHITDELDNLRLEIKEKMDLIDVLETNNQDLEMRAERAEEEARNLMHELEQTQDQQIEQQDKFDGDKEEQIAQMHEDMQRLLEFKNELEALIEEQNGDIEGKNEKINKLTNELKHFKGEFEKGDSYVKNLEKQLKEYKSKCSVATAKFNRLKQGKITELQKKNRDLKSEVTVLKDMVKSSKNEVRSKDISIKKFRKRLTSLEKISQIRSKVSEIASMNSGRSNRGRSRERDEDHYPYEEEYDYENHHQNHQAIEEAAESLEATGNQQPYYESPQKPVLYSKTPNIKISKNINNSKITSLKKYSPDRIHPGRSMPRMNSNPFSSKVTKGYDYYKDSLSKPDFKNNSYGMKGVFSQASGDFELPAIKESQGAIILDRKRLDVLKRDI
ncbi:unnamed protein product [Moneuplotes crassus]|uniref:Uncharacterized protein n=1 Tax=Euplotes crassus TaxID=5936 RepID=A0AAD1X346_EUPCR|nr:unnamed protein product [Moneuplotes crassus]